jgi:hypothetical protein
VDATGFEAAALEAFERHVKRGRDDDAASRLVGYLAVYSPRGSGTLLSATGETPYLMQEPSVGSQPTPVLSWALEVERPGTRRQPRQRLSGREQRGLETVAVLAVLDHLFAQHVADGATGAVAIRMRAPEHDAALEWGTAMTIDSGWKTVPLARRYGSPVIVVEPMLLAGMEPYSTQVRNVTGDSFEVRCGSALTEICSGARVTYLVAEEGAFSVGALEVRAGTISTSMRLDQGWNQVNFDSPFGEAPGVFAGVQTHNNEASLTARVHRLDESGFDVSLQGATQQPLTSETIGWIAIERGAGATSDGRRVTVYSNTLDRTPRAVRGGVRRGETSRDAESDAAGALCVTIGVVGSTFNPVESFVVYETLPAGAIEAFISSRNGHSDEIVEDVHFFQGE